MAVAMAVVRRWCGVRARRSDTSPGEEGVQIPWVGGVCGVRAPM